ncbi:lantibiotic dehydratase C-terminal domain-containing protein [Nonomuraea sp. 10N515B]|uniref:lantibiotic dehydratase C-terminal domain-containing protein n=1 Tax=Nonomuraea sp. 10N515B TaxID=3457422 RepID=UPI003FCE4ED1
MERLGELSGTERQGELTGMDWWYVRAYPGGAELMDPAVRLLVPWLREQAAREGAARWFFVRYWDMTGHHLRLRLSCPADGVDRMHERLPELEDLLAALRPEPVERLVPGDFPGPLPARRAAAACLYAPELGKYGGAAGVALAEELFTTSCAWYADARLTDLDRTAERAALAVAYMRELGNTLPEPERKGFWAAHRAHWGWQLRLAVPGQDRLRALLVKTASALPACPSDVAAQVEAVRAVLDGAAAASVPVSRAELLLQYMHMDLNRLGFVPAEECLLGLIACQ